MKKLKLLEIIPTIPYPVKAGGTMALYTMLDGLRKYMDITIIFITKLKKESAISELQRLWPDIKFHTVIPPKNYAYYLQKIRGEVL